MNESCFALKGSVCHSRDARTLETFAEGVVVCENGTCRGVFPTLPDAYAGCPVHDYGQSLILPGLVDLHVHASQYAFRGLGMDLQLLDWLHTYAFPEEAKFRDPAYAAEAYAAFAEGLRKGPNTRACVYATIHAPATLLLMDLLEKSGLITRVGKVNMDQNGHPDLEEAGAEASLADTRALLREAAQRGYARTAPILTPRFIPSCSDALLLGLGDLQRETGLCLQSHLSENHSEIAWVAALCPDAVSYADAYDRRGLLGTNGPVVMAHCVWPEDAEIELLQRRGVFVAHCPQSNTNIASGIAPVRRLMGRVPMGLGSDVAGGSSLSIFRAMTDAVQASKLRFRLVEGADAPLTLAEAFYLATAGGGAFFGRVGRFDAGYEMDAVVLDDAPLAPPFPLSVAARLERAAYLSDDRHIRAKYVRGLQVL